MTTSVLVVNRGPKAIDVDVLSVSTFTQQAGTCGSTFSVRNSSVAHTKRLQPTVYSEFTLYDSQEIQIREVAGV